MHDLGVDAVVAVTRFNVQHMLGGYRYFFFANMDAIGLSRYLPALVYRKGAPTEAFYVGCGNEAWGVDVFPLWVPDGRIESFALEMVNFLSGWLQKQGIDGNVGAETRLFASGACAWAPSGGEADLTHSSAAR